MRTFLAMLLKPFLVLGALGLLLVVRCAVEQWLPEGRLKRLLLLDV